MNPNQQFCINCKGDHLSTDKNCPVYLEQWKIKKHMAKYNVSYTEARKSYKTFSEALTQPINNRYSPLATLNEQDTPSDFNPNLLRNPRTHVRNTYTPKQQYRNTQQNNNLTQTPQSSNQPNNNSVIIPNVPQYHRMQNNKHTDNFITQLHLLISNLITENNGSNITIEQLRQCYLSSLPYITQHG